MAKQDLGKKRRCASCGMKFYDFGKTKITCPSCEAPFHPDQLLKSRRGRTSKSAPAAEAAAVETIEEDTLLGDEETDEDDDGLGDDGALVDITPAETEDEDGAAILDDNVDEDFIDDVDEETSEEEL